MAYSAHYGARLAPAFGPRGLKRVEDLHQAPMMDLAQVDDPAALVLRPRSLDLHRLREPRLALRLAWARARGKRELVARSIVDQRYKPVQWVMQAGVPVGYSSADLDRLADLGRRSLALAGVGPSDVLVGIVPVGPHLAWWQLALGARQAGVATLHLAPVPPAERVARFRPTVLAGRPFDLARLLESAVAAGHPLDEVRTLVVVGEPLEAGVRSRLAALLRPADAAVTSMWAPPGARALWAQCRGGTGLHIWPLSEVVEIVDPLSGEAAPPGADGEVVLTALGWRGTVFVRLRTGVYASLEPGPCPTCGSAGARLVVSSSTPAFLSSLDEHPGVAGWQAELSDLRGNEELVVFMAPTPGVRLGPLLAELDEKLSATQYVVLSSDELDARIAALGDRRLIDRRA